MHKSTRLKVLSRVFRDRLPMDPAIMDLTGVGECPGCREKAAYGHLCDACAQAVSEALENQASIEEERTAAHQRKTENKRARGRYSK